MIQPPELLRVSRGGRVESVHHGTLALIEGSRTLLALGDITQLVFHRSTNKPLQAMAAVTCGAVERFGLTRQELALATGSHNASPAHLAVVHAILAKAGVGESALGCGGHWSVDGRVARNQAVEHGPDLDPLPRTWSNCSGKHAAMLAAARALGAPLEGYLEPDHPVQQEITRIIAAFSGIEAARIPIAVDGCGAPAHALPLEAMAHALGKVGRPEGLPDDLAHAAHEVAAAMAAHPDMVAGAGRLDTELMLATGGRVLSKAGAEGVLGLFVPQRGLGLSIKVQDGNDRGYRLVAIEIARRLGLLDTRAADALAERNGRTVKNWAGKAVGQMEVVLPAFPV